MKSSGTSTSKANSAVYPGEKAINCSRCAESFALPELVLLRMKNNSQPILCPRCVNRGERAKSIRKARKDVEDILESAGFERSLIFKTTSSIKTQGEFTDERRREILDIAFSIFNKNKRTKRGICLIGPVGRGKTLLATLLARRFVRMGYDAEHVAICRVPYLEMDAKDQFCLDFEERQTTEGLLSKFSSRDFLVLDDLGIRRGEATPFVQDLLYLLIDERYQERDRKFTVITTNRTLDEIDRDIGSQVASRIIGMCHVIQLCGPDWRLEGE